MGNTQYAGSKESKPTLSAAVKDLVPQSSHTELWWQCVHCTFLNNNASEICEMCLREDITLIDQNAAQYETEDLSSEYKESVQNYESCYSAQVWVCPHCTFVNDDMTGMCKMCGHDPYCSCIDENFEPRSSILQSVLQTEENWIQMDWIKIVNAVKHEMSPIVSSAMEQILYQIAPKNLMDFSSTIVDEMIAILMKKGNLETKAIEYLRKLVERAITYRTLDPEKPPNLEVKHHADLFEEWRGFNISLLFDIFCVKKAHKFTFDQMADYDVREFQNDLETAEQRMNLGEGHIRNKLESTELLQRLQSVSFYPQWLIDDDLFDCMQWIYGATHFLHHLQEKKINVSRNQRVHVYIIPQRVVSLYDPQRTWKFQNMMDQNNLHSKEFYFPQEKTVHMSSVERAQVIQSAVEYLESQNDGDFQTVIVIDRRSPEQNNGGAPIFWIYEIADLTDIRSLNENHCLGFEFQIAETSKCWLHFGDRQRIRFYPEFAISLIPLLFVRTRELRHLEYLRKLYSDQFKHGWALPLDDPVFNLYYKAVTGDDHISNNYHRQIPSKNQNIGSSLGFWEYLRRRINEKNFNALHKWLLQDGMDTDAVFADLIETEKDGRVFIDEQNSNIAINCIMPGSVVQHCAFMELKTAIFRWRKIECCIENMLDLRDCDHFDVVIHHLKTFQDVGDQVTSTNLHHFKLDQVLQSLDHITTVHKLLDPECRAEIHRYITSHVACQASKRCKTMKHYINREREHRSEHVENGPVSTGKIDERFTVIMDVMNSLHSLLLHRDQSVIADSRLNRFKTEVILFEEEKLENERKDPLSSLDGLDLGVSVIRWIPFGERPYFRSLRDEMVNNRNSGIDESLFEQYLIECVAKIQGTTFTLKEMLALKLYTDTTKLQSFLRKAHWVNTPQSEKMKKSYYHWASALYEAAIYHSTFIPSVNGIGPVPLYHGLNKMFTVNEELPKYHGPFSSTTARSVAHHFTKEQGLYFKMQPSYINKLKCCIGINVESISHHKHEREILLIDQFLPISGARTFKNTDSALVDYLIFSVRQWKCSIQDHHSFYRQLGIKFRSEWMPLIQRHPDLFKQTALENMLVITRLVLELKITDWRSSILDGTFNYQLLFYLVEECKVKQLLPLYRVMTSRFKVVQDHHINRCYWVELIRNTKMDHIGDADTVNDLCFKETQYKINGIPVPYFISSVGCIVHQIQCRNRKLFGDKIIWTQKFETTSQDAQERKIDLLVHRHRDKYWRNHHPNKLLDGTMHTTYWSNDYNKAVNDWVIFKQIYNKSFYPLKIMIRNGKTELAIKSIEIEWSVDGFEYHLGARIDKIKRGNEIEQWFDLDTKDRRFNFGKVKYIKLKIERNYGDPHGNAFHEFGIRGICPSVTDQYDSVLCFGDVIE